MKTKKTFEGRSKFETRVGQDLEERGVSFSYELRSFEYKRKPYQAKCGKCGSDDVWEKRKYTPDFFLLNGIIIEAKGNWTGRERKLLLAVLEENQDLDIRMLFMRDNWLTKKHVQRYIHWCTSRGIKWAIGRVPGEWVDE